MRNVCHEMEAGLLLYIGCKLKAWTGCLSCGSILICKHSC